jgi:L-histidine N-alpha-methyltransferase
MSYATPATPRGLAGPDFTADVVAGLRQAQKRLEAKYFYDQEGSRLFDRICELDEYYPTQTEIGILRDNAHKLSEILWARSALVELGSGSSFKTRLLLDALPEIATYVPLDISREHLGAAAKRIAIDYSEIAVRPLVADFTRPMALPRELEAVPKLLFFPGSTIGNFTLPEAQTMMARLRQLPRVVGLVVGVDLIKDIDMMVAAYDDREGVTAAFNKNLLVRINRELDGNFDLAAFRHEARWNAAQSRIEMHLVSKRQQRVSAAGETFDFAKGETIHTENSHKFTLDRFQTLARDAGWLPSEAWTDTASFFSVHVLTPG